MKIGLISRCETSRGLGIQTKAVFDNLPIERVLLIRMPRPDCEERPDWYPGATQVDYDPRGWTIDERVAREWMDGLDVVFSVETLYDKRFPEWAKQMGVKTVIQGNPEFIRHGLTGYEDLIHPDAWWWPTSWRTDLLPPGTLMPVPMPDHEPTGAQGGRLRIVHIAGKRAFHDRNGTDIVASMLGVLRADVHVTMHGLDHCLPDLPRPRRWTMEVENIGVEDRWSMYDNQHILIMPRRYAGLCLPALEAASRGVAVLMTDCSPNRELAQLFITPRRVRRINVAAGQIDSHDVNHLDLARDIDMLASSPQIVREAQRRAWSDVPRWSEWKQKYLDEFAKIIG